jgi:hypothetical protein
LFFRKEIHHANLLSKYFQIKETNHQTNLNFSLHKPFSFSYLPSKKQENEEEERHSSVFTPLLKVISLDCNHETKSTLLSYLQAIKHTPKNASILFLSSTVIKASITRRASHAHPSTIAFPTIDIGDNANFHAQASPKAPHARSPPWWPHQPRLAFLRLRIDSRRDCCVGWAQTQP